MPNDVLTLKALKPFDKEFSAPALKTKLEKALDEYDTVAAGEDYGAQVTTLEKIDEVLYELEKKEKDASEKLKKHFAQMEKAVKSELSGAKEGLRLEASMAKKRGPAKQEEEEDEDEGEEEGDGKLESILKVIKTRGDQPEKPLKFVAYKGKPYALAIAKKIGNKHKKAMKEKAGGNINFTGDVIFEAAAHTFVLDDAPPRGLAKQLKQAIYEEVGKQFKIRVRDRANLNVLDDELDTLPDDEAPVNSSTGTTSPPPEVTSGPKVSDLVGKFDAGASQNLLQQKLMTLIRTLGYALKQEPDEAVRLMESIENDVNKALKLIEKDKSITPPKAAGEVVQKIVEAKQKIVDNIDKLTKEHALKWLSELAPLIKEEAKPSPKQLLHAINVAEEGMKLDLAMLKRLKQPTPELYEKIQTAIAKAREKYKACFPVRTLKTAPIDPPKANRPAAGNLGKDFTTLVDSSEGAMAKGEKPSTDTLDKMVEQINLAIPTNLRKDLKDDYKNWDGVKGEFKKRLATDKVAATKFMSDYWWFRRSVVDELMAKLQKKYDFSWASVGSANLESDYDITINSHGTANGKPFYDFQIVAEFNQTISQEFSCQPGTLFDTNLYSSAKVEAPVTTGMTQDQQQTVKDMQAMGVAGQDVGSLMKMRRYMDWEGYAAYQKEILGDIEKDLAKAAKGSKEYKTIEARLEAAERQFDTADVLYFQSLQKQLLKAGLTPPKDLTPAGQKELLRMAKELGDNADKMMEVNNQLYVEAMVNVRGLEEELKSLGEGDVEKKNATYTKLRNAYADAIFFAAEAYHSEGPFKHIVEARQSSAAKVKNGEEFKSLSDPEKNQKINELTNEAIGKLSVPQMMQSFNENLGDMLKDLEHYEHKSDLPAMGFFRSSKYFERLCDAMDIIGAKLKGTDVEKEFTDIKIGTKTPADMRSALGSLVKVRGGAGFKSKKEFPNDEDAVENPELELEAFVIEEMQKALPGITTLRDLAAAVLTAGAKVNAVLRKAAAAESMIAEDEGAYFKG